MAYHRSVSMPQIETWSSKTLSSLLLGINIKVQIICMLMWVYQKQSSMKRYVTGQEPWTPQLDSLSSLKSQ